MGLNVTDTNVTYIVSNLSQLYSQSQSAGSTDNQNINKFLYNYFVLSLISIACSFLGFAIRDTFREWQLDIFLFILVFSD